MELSKIVSEYKKRQMINRLADMAIKKITKRHLVKEFRKVVGNKVFTEGDTLNISYTVNVSGEFTGKIKRR